MTDESRTRTHTRTRTRRRTLLKTIFATSAASAIPTGVAARTDDCTGSGRPGRLPPRVEPPSGETLANRPDAFVATVDRIVDGRHVVALLEDDGEPVDQLVVDVDSDALPAVEESDVLVVSLTCEGDLADARVLEEETERRRERNRDRFDDLLGSSLE